jgi:branched-subunit amino acid aminotransferase/4-amino-4-deoxychorismate lyase
MSLNRAFMYGESVFTTMRMVNGEVKDWDLHFDRLKKGVDFVYGPFTDEGSWVALLKNLLEAKFQALSGDQVIRLTVFREQARGIVRSGMISVSELSITASATAFDSSRVENKMVKLRTCPAQRRPLWWPSTLKAGNYLETILSQKMFLKADDDDLLFLAPDDTILESSVANIFVVRHGKIYTAPLGPNVLDGVMRRKVIQHSKEFFLDVEESASRIDQALKADAVFGSNSVRGLFLVDRIDDYEISYHKDFLEKFLKLKDKVMS